MKEFPGEWDSPRIILVILAHPDDPEFFCGATLAKWADAGHDIHYLILTHGEKGGGLDLSPTVIYTTRDEEQKKAAQVIGTKSVQFMNHEDGYLVPSLELRREIVCSLRRYKPDIVVTCDPTYLYLTTGYGVNHPDHRAVGQVVIDAIFPAAGNIHYFPELFQDDHLSPHNPRELWLSLTGNPNTVLDITSFIEIKISALLEHKSQIGDPEILIQRIRSRHVSDNTSKFPRYEEKFRVIKFRLK